MFTRSLPPLVWRSCQRYFSAPLFLFSAPAQAGKIASYEAGSWFGGAYDFDETGAFSHCVFQKRYPKGRSLLFAVDSNRNWSFGFANEKWKLKKGTTYNVRFRIDDGESLEGLAKAKNNRLAQVQLPNTRKLVRTFQAGRELAVRAGKSTLRYDLAGVREMLNELSRCSKKHNAAARAKPDSDFEEPDEWDEPKRAETATPRFRPTPQTRTESRTAVKFLLKIAELDGEIRPVESLPASLKKFDVVWRMKGSIGTFGISPTEDLSLTQVAKRARTLDQRDCKGDFDFGKTAEEPETYYSFMSTCSKVQSGDEALDLVIFHTFLPRREGGHYVLRVVGRAGTAGKD